MANLWHVGQPTVVQKKTIKFIKIVMKKKLHIIFMQMNRNKTKKSNKKKII